jgi:uncharacterized protein (TIGR02678 family)
MSDQDFDPPIVDVEEQNQLPSDRADTAPSRRKRWHPEATAETAAALRRLAVSPWLIVGRDDETIGAVRRNLPAIREALARLGWVLIAERDFVRLRKSPPARRYASSGDGPTPLQASWFFLIVAAAESLAPRVTLPQLVMAARAAASEAGLPVTHDIAERRAIVHAIRMLDDRGVVMQVDGDMDGFIEDEDARVLLAIHHSRLVHVIANFGSADPTTEPALWLEQVEREPDAARRMRRRLVDDTVVHVADLDDGEADWLSRRVRGDDGGPLATAFGLHLERRAEGAAFVVPDEAFRYLHELGPTPFPAPGTVPHAALLLSEHVAVAGILGSSEHGPGAGWLGLHEPSVIDHVASLAVDRTDGKGGWRRELAEDPSRLAEEIHDLLCGLDLLRVGVAPNGDRLWWFSPAIGRWSSSLAEIGGETIPRPTSVAIPSLNQARQ